MRVDHPCGCSVEYATKADGNQGLTVITETFCKGHVNIATVKLAAMMRGDKEIGTIMEEPGSVTPDVAQVPKNIFSEGIQEASHETVRVSGRTADDYTVRRRSEESDVLSDPTPYPYAETSGPNSKANRTDITIWAEDS